MDDICSQSAPQQPDAATQVELCAVSNQFEGGSMHAKAITNPMCQATCLSKTVMLCHCPTVHIACQAHTPHE